MSNQSSGHHIVPIKYYIFTLIALLVLTVITVAVSKLDFGGVGNILVAMGIASVKASLVLLFFMGLRWDSWLNRAVIGSSFLFVGVFLWLTASDLWTREDVKPVEVKAAAAGVSLEDIEKMMADTSLAKHGESVYNVNCNVCHGAEGRGDGAAGAALNPKPRNFYEESSKWKNGTSVRSLYVTLTYGIPGGGMAGYPTLPPKDRIALAHFIRAKVPDGEADSKADDRFKDALAEDGIGGSGGAAKKSIPVDFALERML